jgi:hypothetical protein
MCKGESMMRKFDNFLVSILNAILRGEFLPDTGLENLLGFNEIKTATMKYNIRKSKINTAVDIKDRNSALFIMITKSLAFLTMNTQGQDDKILYYTEKSVTDLKKYLDKLWGKPVTETEYHIILNQAQSVSDTEKPS